MSANTSFCTRMVQKRSTRRQNELRLVLKQKTGIEVGKGVVYWLIDNSDL